MKTSTPFTAVFVMSAVAIAVAQPGTGRGAPSGGPAPATVSAHVYDADLQVPVEYATVILYRLAEARLGAGRK